jgi:hypothetical protein
VRKMRYFVFLCQVIGDSDEDKSDGDEELGDEEWRTKSAKVRYSLNMPTDAAPWTGTHRLTGVPADSKRQLDLIQVSWWAWKLEHMKLPNSKESDTPSWYCDVSQQIDRLQWGPHPQTITQRSRLYAFHLDKVLDGEDRCPLGRHCIHSPTVRDQLIVHDLLRC